MRRGRPVLRGSINHLMTYISLLTPSCLNFSGCLSFHNFSLVYEESEKEVTFARVIQYAKKPASCHFTYVKTDDFEAEQFEELFYLKSFKI